MARQQKSVFITGCSEGGIGYGLAEEFARRGCRVFATARRLDRMAGLQQLGCTLLTLDTTKADSIAAAAQQVLQQLPDGPDILINNAGVGMRGPVLEAPISEVRALTGA
ncbi:MAG: hypothetical protein J3K34DRAFT_52943 [Monoraphidium minutum]|nr:MAG: hypothetical protein J3K34DRAFT_52943 [Monoraphidium minutum]